MYPSFHWQGSRTIFNESLTCDTNEWQGAEAAAVILDFGASVDADFYFGFSASGSLIPPKLDQFSSFIGKNYIHMTYPEYG